MTTPLHPDFAGADRYESPVDDIDGALAYHHPDIRIEDVAAVDAYHLTTEEGVWSPGKQLGREPGVAALLHLKDGSWLGLEGWADYTGWDCQSGADFWRADSRDECIALMSAEARRTLGFEPPAHTPADLYREG